MQRETKAYIVSYTISAKGKRLVIRCKDKNAAPRQRTWHGATAHKLAAQLAPMSEASLNGSICLELGVGAFSK